MADVRFGIMGLGRGRKAAEQVANAAGAKLVCVSDLQEEKAKEYGELYSCDWTTDHKEMFARDDIDVIGVYSSSGTHCDYAMEAIAAGKHAFVTKPMDVRVEKCDAAIQAAKGAGKVLAVDFGNRYSLENRQLKAAIDQGIIGKIFLGDVKMKWWREQSYYNGGYPLGWRSRLETEGGSIANQGVHFVDLIYWLLGPVKEVYGRSTTMTHDIETEDLSAAQLTFQSGAWGLITTTTSNYPNLGTQVEISGTEGTVSWNQKGGIEITTKDEDSVDLNRFEVPDAPADIAEDMVSAITKGTPPVVSGEEGKKSVEIFNAVYKSSETGQPVGLNQ
ncbi:MAG: Gfo/Idh/MocA family oxidoreductase [Candidatus Latescibacteria bacterium]|nr:Gfo/Idh/MocA family oxidoreductase [Candidatus Latescibacterota bacterium]